MVLYILLCGFPPFYADNDAQLFEKIKRGAYEFLRPYWDPISDPAKDFVRSMLIVDPTKRKTLDQLLDDPWLAEAKLKEQAHVAKDEAGTNLSTGQHLKESGGKLKKLKGAFLAAWAVAALEPPSST